jgi:hypothetical protein
VKVPTSSSTTPDLMEMVQFCGLHVLKKIKTQKIEHFITTKNEKLKKSKEKKK